MIFIVLFFYFFFFVPVFYFFSVLCAHNKNKVNVPSNDASHLAWQRTRGPHLELMRRVKTITHPKARER